MQLMHGRGAPAAVAARRMARPHPMWLETLLMDIASDSSAASGRFHVTRSKCAASSVDKCICIQPSIVCLLRFSVWQISWGSLGGNEHDTVHKNSYR